MRISTALLSSLLLFSAACTGDIVPLPTGSGGTSSGAGTSDGTDTGTGDGTGTGTGDGTGTGTGDGTGDGTGTGTTQSVKFDPDIETDIETKGCSLGPCHGGANDPILNAGAAAANYTNFVLDAQNGEMSLVLTKNLAGSGQTHTGGTPFTSTADPVYQRWLAWINAGNPQ